jgi:hypothetical protein
MYCFFQICYRTQEKSPQFGRYGNWNDKGDQIRKTIDQIVDKDKLPKS